MGLDANAIRFILDAKANGAAFDCVATIGRQTLQIDEQTLGATLGAYGFDQSGHEAHRILSEADGFCEPLLSLLGASEICSIDMSSYQNAVVLHDMNDPLPESLRDKFSLVIDGGSLEHVFNFPRAIANCMEMLRVGGRFIASSPTNNFMGHGFYQFSPELYFRVFNAANGFVTERMVIYQDCWPGTWHDVSDPEQVRQRVTLINRYPALLLVQARKRAGQQLFTATPQQSDYVTKWEGTPGPASAKPPEEPRRTSMFSSISAFCWAFFGKLAPAGLKKRYRRMTQGPSPYDPRFYRPVGHPREL